MTKNFEELKVDGSPSPRSFRETANASAKGKTLANLTLINKDLVDTNFDDMVEVARAHIAEVPYT
jgi:hypothetical protein